MIQQCLECQFMDWWADTPPLHTPTCRPTNTTCIWFMCNSCLISHVAVRVLESHEIPLKLQLDHSQKTPYVELRLLQVRDVLPPPLMSSTPTRGRSSGLLRAGSEESLDEDNGHNIVPKDEGKRVVGSLCASLFTSPPGWPQ